MPAPSDFSKITESASLSFSVKQLQMFHCRYSLALPAPGVTIEIGAGSGLGADFFTNGTYIATDFDAKNVARRATTTLTVRSTAESIPFRDETADQVLALEMIYYLPDRNLLYREASRVLKRDGRFVISLPNAHIRGFHSSPFSTSYPSASELTEELRVYGFETTCFGAFPVSSSFQSQALRTAFGVAHRLKLFPRTLEGRAKIKRIVQGKTTPFPGAGALPAAALDYESPVELHSGRSHHFSMIYAVAKKVGPSCRPTNQRTITET